MARKPQARSRVVTRTTEEITDPDAAGPDVEDETADLDPEAETLDSIFAEVRGHDGVELRVYKLNPDNKMGSRAYCTAVSLADADSGKLLDTLQRRWGGGEYELVARADGRIVRRATLTVLALPSNEMNGNEPGGAAASIAAALAPMNQTLQQLAQLVSQRPQFDLNAILATVTQAAPALVALKSLFGGAAAPVKSDLEAYIETKMKFDALGLGEHEPSTLAQLATVFKDYIAPALKPPAVPALPRMTLAAPTVVGAGPVIPNPAMELFTMLKPLIPHLKRMAESGTSPEDAAEQLNDLIPDQFVDPIADAIEDGTLMGMLSVLPDLKPHAPWLSQAAQSLLELLTAEDEPGAESGVESQDVSSSPASPAPENPAG